MGDAPAAAAPAALPQATVPGLLVGTSKRKACATAAPDRTALEWQCVTVTADHDTTPTVHGQTCGLGRIGIRSVNVNSRIIQEFELKCEFNEFEFPI